MSLRDGAGAVRRQQRRHRRQRRPRRSHHVAATPVASTAARHNSSVAVANAARMVLSVLARKPAVRSTSSAMRQVPTAVNLGSDAVLSLVVTLASPNRDAVATAIAPSLPTVTVTTGSATAPRTAATATPAEMMGVERFANAQEIESASAMEPVPSDAPLIRTALQLPDRSVNTARVLSPRTPSCSCVWSPSSRTAPITAPTTTISALPVGSARKT